MTLRTPDRLQTPPYARLRRQQEPDMAPPLNARDRLSRAEFERRYQAHPESSKAELIEGVVHRPSPVRFAQHSRPHVNIIGWPALYCAATPGVVGGDSATMRLDYENVVQPDARLRLEPALGGRSRVTDEDYAAGPPELIVEIAAGRAAGRAGTCRLCCWPV